jgi:hypothetical protein
VCVWGVRGDKGEREIKGLCTSSTCPAGIIPADQLINIKYSRRQQQSRHHLKPLSIRSHGPEVHTIYTPTDQADTIGHRALKLSHRNRSWKERGWG